MVKKPPYEELAQRIVALEKKVAKHKQLEEALQESEVRYRGIFEYTKNGVAVYKAVNDGEDFIFLDFNQAGEKIDNIKREKLIGLSVLKISSMYYDLTPTEIQVAALIKEGKTTKDIANMLNKSPHAINFHRNNIRKKIGLQNKKTNLRSYLLSFE